MDGARHLQAMAVLQRIEGHREVTGSMASGRHHQPFTLEGGAGAHRHVPRDHCSTWSLPSASKVTRRPLCGRHRHAVRIALNRNLFGRLQAGQEALVCRLPLVGRRCAGSPFSHLPRSSPRLFSS